MSDNSQNYIKIYIQRISTTNLPFPFHAPNK